MIYLQHSIRDADIKNRFVDTVREGEHGTILESRVETYILPYVKIESQWEFAV